MPAIISDDGIFKLKKIYHLLVIDKDGYLVRIYQNENDELLKTYLTPLPMFYWYCSTEKDDEESDEEIECNHDFKNLKNNTFQMQLRTIQKK